MPALSTEGLSPGKLDSAETFSESAVTLAQSQTRVQNQSVELWGLGNYGTGATRSSDNATYSGVSDAGLLFDPNVELTGVEVTCSANVGSTSGWTGVAIERHSDGTVLGSTSVSSISAGDVITVLSDTVLQPGTTYRIVANSDGTGDSGYYDSASFPIAGDNLDFTAGWVNDGSSSSWAFMWSEVRGSRGPSSGSVTVEWPYPDDPVGRDRTLHSRTLDSETVDVYIEDQNGNTLAGPVSSGDSIPANVSTNIRYRVDISRANVANNPTLDSVHRRYLIG